MRAQDTPFRWTLPGVIDRAAGFGADMTFALFAQPGTIQAIRDDDFFLRTHGRVEPKFAGVFVEGQMAPQGFVPTILASSLLRG